MNNIDILNSKLIFIYDQYSINLAYGKMGLCVYLFYLSRYEEKDEYLQVANRLLDEIIADMPNHKEINLEHGLAGIGIGLSYLVKENFVDGDINDVLEEVDSYIFRSLAFVNKEEAIFSKSTLIHLIYYFYIRQSELQSPVNKYLFRELIIKLIEMFQHNLQQIFFKEQSTFSIENYQSPAFLFVASKIFELNIYNQRTTKIIDVFFGQILSTFPVLHSNRLYLLFGLLCIKPYLPNYEKEINVHIGFLKEKIDIEYIINIEFKNQDIFVNDGLSFVYILLIMIQKRFSEYSITFNPQSFYNRIKNSEAWSTLINKDYYLLFHRGLYDGFPGVNLVLMHIKKHFKL
jgi:Lanthionine synthetase C-like protein.